jgi:hypothetical protein
MALKRTYKYLYIIYVVIYQVKYVQTSPAMTSGNYERICLNKYNFFLNLAFGQVGEEN